MELNLFIASIYKSVAQLQSDVEKLYASGAAQEQQVLDHLNREVTILERKLQKFSKANQGNEKEVAVFAPLQAIQKARETNETYEMNDSRGISLEELALHDGKNGNLAYIAINGVVYDVTNSPAWAAGTHFGLRAGSDVTDAFASCHNGDDILSKLPVVGFLE